jgi:hypothetical protein
MDDRDSINLNGTLLEWPVREIERAQLEQCTALQYKGPIGDSRWEEFTFVSEQPLRGEEDRGRDGPFRYLVVCRRSGRRIAILSLSRRIVDRLTARLVSEVFALRFRRVTIAVDSLVKALVEHPTVYSLSFACARAPAFGAALRNVSFYGDDLGEASLFRENLHLLNCFVCGIRAVSGGSEIVRLNSDGRISFKMPKPDTVRQVEHVLRFLRGEGYLSTEIWPED